MNFLLDQFFSPSDLKRLRESYPEWILFGIAVLAVSVVVVDPFNVLW